MEAERTNDWLEYLDLQTIQDKLSWKLLLDGFGFMVFDATFNNISTTGVEHFFGQAQAQGFLNFFNPSPVSDLPSPNL